jgi:hypothetical protein
MRKLRYPAFLKAAVDVLPGRLAAVGPVLRRRLVQRVVVSVLVDVVARAERLRVGSHLVKRTAARSRLARMAQAKLLARSGPRYMVDAGRGDVPEAAAKDVPLARVYDTATDTLTDPWPVSSLAARGYWEPVDGVPEVMLEDVSAKADAAMARR